MFGIDLTIIAAWTIIVWYALKTLGYLLVFWGQSTGIMGFVIGPFAAVIWPILKGVDEASKI